MKKLQQVKPPLCHTVKHDLSYNSTDCLVKLNEVLVQASKIVKKMQMGRTKAEMIAQNVLGPKTVEDILNDLHAPEGEPVNFSVAIDASKETEKRFQRLWDISLWWNRKLHP